MGIWIASAGLGYVLADIASFDTGHILESISSWRYIFLSWGSITTSRGIVIFSLPDNPLDANFSMESERRGVTLVPPSLLLSMGLKTHPPSLNSYPHGNHTKMSYATLARVSLFLALSVFL
jgi:hypothetical protein